MMWVTMDMINLANKSFCFRTVQITNGDRSSHPNLLRIVACFYWSPESKDMEQQPWGFQLKSYKSSYDLTFNPYVAATTGFLRNQATSMMKSASLS